jgi:hypothetical protein
VGGQGLNMGIRDAGRDRPNSGNKLPPKGEDIGDLMSIETIQLAQKKRI